MCCAPLLTMTLTAALVFREQFNDIYNVSAFLNDSK